MEAFTADTWHTHGMSASDTLTTRVAATGSGSAAFADGVGQAASLRNPDGVATSTAGQTVVAQVAPHMVVRADGHSDSGPLWSQRPDGRLGHRGRRGSCPG